jgi:hypothetical protein
MAKLIIKARSFLEDIKSGMSGPDLMNKYRLSSKGLRIVFKKLAADANVVAADLYANIPLEQELDDFASVRMFVRSSLGMELTIVEAGRPENCGIVRDISQRGVGVRGLKAEPDEVKSLMVPDQGLFFMTDPLEFDVVCRWIKRDRSTGEYNGGYEITNISTSDFERLKDMIRLLTASDWRW